jgi:hypothetical protein
VMDVATGDMGLRVRSNTCWRRWFARLWEYLHLPNAT